MPEKTKKTLFIVESPAKARTVEKILGKSFIVMASIGHVRDLIKGGRGEKGLGVSVEKGYEPHYKIIPGKEKIVKALQKAGQSSKEVYLAPDPDREGEAIAWHLKEIMDLHPDKAKRVTYSSITKKAILEALQHPRSIDMNLVNAQQGRRILDRLVGFNLSPFLWKTITRNLSAGRVQSVAVEMVVLRERAIAAFKQEEFWKITAKLVTSEDDTPFVALLSHWDGERFTLGEKIAASKESAELIVKHLKEETFKVSSLNTRRVEGRPRPPFVTATLQQAASTQLGLRPSRTMMVAQSLYEGVDLDEEGPVGLITYMRTDSTRIAPEALAEVRTYITSHYSPDYLPAKPFFYATKKGAQDAHEAIRPTYVEKTPELVKPLLSREQYRLYSLIWTRFVASQMSPAVYQLTTASITAGSGIFKADGRQTLFDGYTILIPKESDKKIQILPILKERESLLLKDLSPSQHFSKPPARYTEASLVKALEKEGIGRPSTYAPIVRTIREKGYVLLENKSFRATELGMSVTDLLAAHFPEIMDIQFTARLEASLDKVEEGDQNWIDLLDSFYKPFLASLAQAQKEAKPLKRAYEGPERCPLCGGSLFIRYSTRGAFLGCQQFPECKGTTPLPGENQVEEVSPAEVTCPECAGKMIIRQSRHGKKFYSCEHYPQCTGTLSADSEGNPIVPPRIEEVCDICGGTMGVKAGKRGFFLACKSYPSCKNTLPLSKNGEILRPPVLQQEILCEKCQKPMAIKYGRRGFFLACTGYPKCKNARPLPKNAAESTE